MGNSHKNLLVWNQVPWIKAAFNNNAMALWWPSWWENATAGHNFGRGPSNDYSIQVWFQTRWFLCEFPIGHHSAIALLLKAALIQVSDYRLLGASGHFFKRSVICHLNFQKIIKKCL
jgi:hypothetical protein